MVELWTNLPHIIITLPLWKLLAWLMVSRGLLRRKNWFLNWMLTVKKTSTVLKRFLKNVFVSLFKCAVISYVVGKRLCLILTSRWNWHAQFERNDRSVFPIFKSPQIDYEFCLKILSRKACSKMHQKLVAVSIFVVNFIWDEINCGILEIEQKNPLFALRARENKKTFLSFIFSRK